MPDEVRDVVEGEGWAAANVDALSDEPGFRKVRRAIGVTAFGVNAIELPPGLDTGSHYHDVQEELYFVHSGRLRMSFGDGRSVELGPGAVVKVDPATHRKVSNVGDEPAVYLIVGGKDGYVGRDGRQPEGEARSGKAS